MLRPRGLRAGLYLLAAVNLLYLAYLAYLKESPCQTNSARWTHEGGVKSTEMPFILHQVFIQDERRPKSFEVMLFEKYRPLINSCLTVNADWTYYLWRNSDALALISKEYPQYLSTYKGFSDLLQRSDAIRYLVLHRFGGIYLDMDVECFKPFNLTLTKHPAFLDQERLEQTQILWNKEFSASNSLMGSVPGHPFFRKMAEKVLSKELPGGPIFGTGPVILTQMFMEHRDSPMAKTWPVTLLPPFKLMDNSPDWKSLCSKANVFGDNSNISWRQRGCLTLIAKNWRLDETDSDSITVHRWMHLGFGPEHRFREPLFNVTTVFGRRVQFFNASSSTANSVQRSN